MSIIQNTRALLAEGTGRAEKKIRGDLLRILEFTLARSDPFYLTRKVLKELDLSAYRRIYVIGAGKGTYRMALAAEKVLGKRLTGGWINVPAKLLDGQLGKIKITLAGHPFPNQGSVLGARRILRIVKNSQKDDLIIALFSGGASALCVLPVAGISLADKIKTTELLLCSGAVIQEVNAVRKHLSQIKGGRLAQAASQTNLTALYLSDVVGDDMSVVASGPTVPDKSSFQNALSVLRKYDLLRKIPPAARARLEAGKRGEAPETPKKIFGNIKNILIGSHRTLVEAARQKAKDLGYQTIIATDKMQGETAKIGRGLIQESQKKPGVILLAAGETTFKVQTKNPGGRNQQMGLAVLPYLRPGQCFLAFDSDGVDGVGPEKVGGVLIDYAAKEKTRRLALDARRALAINDSFNFFKQAGGLIRTGYVGTNLGDIVMIVQAKNV